MRIAGTGHRPDKLGGYRIPNTVSDAVGALLRQYLQRERPDEVISGMALGFDQWLAWMCIELNIPFAAYIPCDNFDSRWPGQSREEYRHLLSLASRVVEVSPGEPYHASLMQRRNVRMVDDTDKVIALWNGTTGGTANCIRYARSVNKPVDYLPVPVEIWDEARAWEEAHVRRNRPPPAPVWGRQTRHINRPRSNIVDQLLEEQANENNDVVPDIRVEIHEVEAVSRPFDPNRPIIDVRGMPEDLIRQVQTELRNARNDRQRRQALERYNLRRQQLIARLSEDDRDLTTRLPRLTDEFPLPAPLPADAPRDERMRQIAEQLRDHLDTDVLRALVEQNRHLLPAEPDPEPKEQSTNGEDRFMPRRKIDFDE